MRGMPVSFKSEDKIYTLGETGDTVIYIFPNGNALMDRETDAIADKLQSATSHPAKADPAQFVPSADLGERLVAEGVITTAQYSVARYDQAATGMSLMEALIARGWLSA